MNFHWPLFGRAQPHVVVKYVAATRQESVEAKARREARTAALKATVASMSPAQRRAAIARAQMGEGR